MCCTDTRASPAHSRISSSRSSWWIGTFHQSACSATSAIVFGPVPPITIGIFVERRRHLPGGDQLEPLALVVERLAGPERAHDLERLLQAADALARRGRLHAVRRELLDHRTPADAELEAATRRVVERDGLAREHRRMTERIAQHELALHEPVGVREQPRVGGERLVHVVLLGHRWREVVHAGHAGEAGRLGGARLLDHGVHGQAHLREVEVELGSAHRGTT